MGEDAAPGEMHASRSGAALPPGHPKDYVAVGCQLSTWPWELISHPDDATDTCFERCYWTRCSTNGASCPSKAPDIPPPKPCNPRGPSPWICTPHRRLAPCPAAGGSQNLRLENRERVLEGGPRAPLSQFQAGGAVPVFASSSWV